MAIHIREKIRARDTMIVFDVSCSGRRTRVSSGITYHNPAEQETAHKAAQAVLKRTECELYRRCAQTPSITAPASELLLTLADVVRMIEAGTMRQRRAICRYLASYGIAGIAADDLEPETIRGFFSALARHCKPGTVRRYAAVLKTCLARAYEAGMISKNPAVLVRMPRPIDDDDGRAKGLSDHELQRLAHSTCDNDVVKRAFLFSCETGLRLCDVARITAAHIRGNVIEMTQHKTGKRVMIPLTPYARTLLWPCPVDGPIFTLPHPSTVNRILHRWGQVAGCTHRLTFHAARHTCARRLIDSGVPVPVVGKILGHRSLASTLQYVRPADSAVIEAVARMSFPAPGPEAG